MDVSKFGTAQSPHDGPSLVALYSNKTQLEINCIPWLVFTAIAQKHNSFDSTVLVDHTA